MIPTTTQLFQQSYHLGLGWGLAEAVWGTVKGWFAGMRLYVDVLPVDRSAATKAAGLSGEQKIRVAQGQSRGDEEERVYDGQDVEHRTQDDSAVIDIEQEDDDDDNVSDVSAEEEEDLATKIAILERLRGRRELEQILGIPFPNIALPLHLLWRIDALLFNLGLTLIVSAYWYDIEPIYTRHSHRSSPLPPPSNGSGGGGNGYPPFPPVGSQRHHRLFPLIMFGVIAVHVVVSLVWSLGVRKAGIGAVTWGSLIISLGAVFAGLGA
ncbi:hypothetical protein QFC24_003955 [Naganishia onofrii]|uniref:Uncharacterized protein n=1 Tax=Naganishia onofrii TaxID=1851511 RepID=A0ACC2XG69_9TREE|nr:hypothetical protein QFC24_003955 [Naganishia onofrii]